MAHNVKHELSSRLVRWSDASGVHANTGQRGIMSLSCSGFSGEMIVALLAVSFGVGCGSKVPKPEVEELVSESDDIAEGSGAGRKKDKSKHDNPNPYENKEPRGSDTSAEACGAKDSREDCKDCCAAVGSEACTTKAACEAKPPADDCRVNGCATGTCGKCHFGWLCVGPNQRC
jgi:hypothetical protein